MNDYFPVPKKSLGQNFLQDANIIRKIVASLNIKPTDIVLEIGPGRGALTELMLPLAKQLHVVEFDRDLSQYWRDRAEGLENLIVHERDILKFDIAEIFNSERYPSGAKLKVIGNLPYNISSPVLFHLMQYADKIGTQIVMLQKEVVQRMASPPGSKQYGRLSVMLQYRYHIENLFTVPPTAFIPAPKVDSAIARLTPRENMENSAIDLGDFSMIVKAAFAQRRKTLRNTLKEHLNAEQIESVDVQPIARAETLAVGDFVNLSNLYSQSK